MGLLLATGRFALVIFLPGVLRALMPAMDEAGFLFAPGFLMVGGLLGCLRDLKRGRLAPVLSRALRLLALLLDNPAQ